MTNDEVRMTNQTTNDKLQCPLTRLRRVLVIVVCRLLFAVRFVIGDFACR